MKSLSFAKGKVSRLGGVPDAFAPLAVAAVARAAGTGTVLQIEQSAEAMEAALHALRFFAPELEVLTFPAWDCMPYDRVSPSVAVLSRRMDTLGILNTAATAAPRVVLTTINAALQRVPPRSALAAGSFHAGPGDAVDLDDLQALLARDGYARAGTVREPGEYAVRGGLLDVFPAGAAEPLRLDLFGDRLESVRTFDPLTQRTTGDAPALRLIPAGEFRLDPESIARFRAAYQARFGAVGADDPVYASVSAGRRHAGAEHWLPLFHDGLDTLFSLLPEATVVLAHGIEEARAARLALIADNYAARLQAPHGTDSVTYRPLPPEGLTMTDAEWTAALGTRAVVQLSPFDELSGGRDRTGQDGGGQDMGARPGRDFAAERVRAPTESGTLVLDAVRDHIDALRTGGRRVIVAAVSHGSRERLAGLLLDHGVGPLAHAANWPEVERLPETTVAMAVLGLERGFESAHLAVLSEQDILGERIARPPRRGRQAEDFIREVSALSAGDLVVHVDHGIGRFEGLEAITVNAQPHDCAVLAYDGGDRMFVPVENIEVISRYGGDESAASLDRLGGSAWQARMARAKKRIREIAGDLLRVAAARAMREAPRLSAPAGAYAEFCARFPYAETEDQERTVAEVLADLASGAPMDRLVCGDVGFGKTEVALRAAFVAAMAGKQVAVVAPTTLLVRQHLRTFRERFAGWPLRIAGLSRMNKAAESAETRRELVAGTVDIVVGTHALLGKNIVFADLGLLIVDEEQRFGVTHKERLKEVRANVHVLTLTATPIPRTLQMALAGVRELSLIATPPVDRLAVRTFILPFDGVVVREALQRELRRGGQVFYVCPRIADLDQAAEFVRANVAEANVAVAHGQMPATQLETVMTAFYEGACNVLVATNIIESGLDIPTANTMIVHRADMFGLSELYQLRGRIGRSKTRAYAYLTIPATRTPTPGAEKRLAVMQSLDGLGAGFSLASHDMDIRGAGNLLGAEQSGHIKEVGFELYQRMLEETVAAVRAAESGTVVTAEDVWSPQINVGTAVLIPEAHVPDLDVRLGLYRRVADLAGAAEIEAFAAEMIDRFGPLPDEVEHLLQIVAIKQALRAAGVERLDAGPRGATLHFRNDSFADPPGLVRYLSSTPGSAKLRPDHSLVVKADWARAVDRLKGVRRIADDLAAIVRGARTDVPADRRA